MKKNLFILGIAALAFAACSNDEVVEVNQGEAISFRPLVNNVTRAAEASFSATNTTPQFAVTAYPTGTIITPYFANITFQGDGTAYWVSSSNKYYWPSDKNLDFYAWAPTTVSSAYNDISFTPVDAAASQVDFVYAKTVNWGKYQSTPSIYDAPSGHKIGDDATAIALNFRHTLSKIIVKVYNTNANLKISVKNVKIGNVSGTGTFNITAATDTHNDNLTSGWTSLGAITSSYTQTDAHTLNGALVVGSAEGVGTDWKLIPQTLTKETTYYNSGSAVVGDPFNGAYISFEIKIQNKADDSYIVGDADTWQEAMWPLNADVWNYGYAYTYNVDLAGGGYYPANHDTNADLDPILEGAEIKFVTANVDDWDNGGTPVVPAIQ